MRRGLYRLWCSISGLWVLFAGVALALNPPGAAYFLHAVAFVVGPPAAILIASAAAIWLGAWIWSGFHGGP